MQPCQNLDVFRPLDPLKVKCKGRPKGATTKTLPKHKRPENDKHLPQERRDLSQFEHILATQQTQPSQSSPSATQSSQRGAKFPLPSRTRKKQPPTLHTLDANFLTALRGIIREEVIQSQAQVDELRQSKSDNVIDISNGETDVSHETDDDEDNVVEEFCSSDEDFASPQSVKDNPPPPRQSSQHNQGTRNARAR